MTEEEIGRLHKDVADGARARTILQDDMVKDALDLLVREAIEGWENTGAAGVEQREQFWRWLQVARRFRDVFVVAMERGDVASQMLADFEAERKAGMI